MVWCSVVVVQTFLKRPTPAIVFAAIARKPSRSALFGQGRAESLESIVQRPKVVGTCGF